MLIMGNSTVLSLFFFFFLVRYPLVGNLLYQVTKSSHLIVSFSHCAVPISHVIVLLSHLVIPLFFFSYLMVSSSYCAIPTSQWQFFCYIWWFPYCFSHLIVLFSHCAVPTSYFTVLLSHLVVLLFIFSYNWQFHPHIVQF